MTITNIEKKREYQRRWIRKRREKYIKLLGPCFVCGSEENIQAHHIDKKVKMSHRIWSWREDRIIEELEKCVGLCQRCHDKLHALEKLKPTIHGTLHAYDQRKCRCDACKAAAAERRKNYW